MVINNVITYQSLEVAEFHLAVRERAPILSVSARTRTNVFEWYTQCEHDNRTIHQVADATKYYAYLCSQRLRKAVRWLADEALHEFDHRARKAELLGTLFDLLSRQFVLDHELRQVADNCVVLRRISACARVKYTARTFRGRSDFNDVAEQFVGFGVRFLNLFELRAQAETERLKLQISVLACQSME